MSRRSSDVSVIVLQFRLIKYKKKYLQYKFSFYTNIKNHSPFHYRGVPMGEYIKLYTVMLVLAIWKKKNKLRNRYLLVFILVFQIGKYLKGFLWQLSLFLVWFGRFREITGDVSELRDKVLSSESILWVEFSRRIIKKVHFKNQRSRFVILNRIFDL